MTGLENMFLRDYKRYLNIEKALENDLKGLPKGSVNKRTIKGNIYYINEYTENSKRFSRMISQQEAEQIKEACAKKLYLKKQLAQLAEYKNFINKKFPHIANLAQDEGQEHEQKNNTQNIENSEKNNYFNENKRYRTIKGDMVRSKSEVIIANTLFSNQIDYEYEKKLQIGKYSLYPDFTIYTKDGGVIYWEHCGMMDDTEYIDKWKWKKSLYEQNNIFEWKNLIVTYENKNKEIDSDEIQKIINIYFK